MAVKYFKVKEELLNPKNINELKEEIESRNMRITDYWKFLNALYSLELDKRDFSGDELKKKRKIHMDEIKESLDYLSVCDQIDYQLEEIKLSIDAKFMLAFIYNTFTGNYPIRNSTRQTIIQGGHLIVRVEEDELMEAACFNSVEKVKTALKEIMDALRISYETDESHTSMNLVCGLERTRKDDTLLWEIDLDRAAMHVLPMNIENLTNYKLIKELPLEDLLDHFEKPHTEPTSQGV